MDYFELPNGSWQGFDDPSQAPAGATPRTLDEFVAHARAITLTADQVTASLYTGCDAAITGGFTSSALGTATVYPSGDTDQANQRTMSIAGGNLRCQQAGTWALHAHTAAQATQVVSDFAVWLNKCQAQLDTLNVKVQAGDLTVVWSNPT